MEDLTDQVASLSVADGPKQQRRRGKKKPSKKEPPCEKPWSRLSADEQNHAKALSFQRETWGDDPVGDEEDGYGEDWSGITWTWEQLEGTLLASAKALGFTESSWKGGEAEEEVEESSGG